MKISSSILSCLTSLELSPSQPCEDHGAFNRESISQYLRGHNYVQVLLLFWCNHKYFFGLCAIFTGGLTVWQGRRVWRLWYLGRVVTEGTRIFHHLLEGAHPLIVVPTIRSTSLPTNVAELSTYRPSSNKCKWRSRYGLAG